MQTISRSFFRRCLDFIRFSNDLLLSTAGDMLQSDSLVVMRSFGCRRKLILSNEFIKVEFTTVKDLER